MTLSFALQCLCNAESLLPPPGAPPPAAPPASAAASASPSPSAAASAAAASAAASSAAEVSSLRCSLLLLRSQIHLMRGSHKAALKDALALLSPPPLPHAAPFSLTSPTSEQALLARCYAAEALVGDNTSAPAC